jgi:hypothetical protein
LTYLEPEQVFRLSEKAAALVTRDAGKRLRAELLALHARLPADGRIRIDLSGVDVLTPSFVDECFGRLVSELGVKEFRARFRIEGADADWKSLINSVVQNRLLLDRQKAAG